MPQLERPIFVLHMSSDYLDRDVELSEAVLGLTPRNLVRVA